MKYSRIISEEHDGYESNDLRFKVDWVDALRCFAWPHEVSNFAYRERNQDWPNAKTIQKVIECRVWYCDVLDIQTSIVCWQQNGDCRFLRAEVVLLRSWTTLQLTVYNLTTILSQGCDFETRRQLSGDRENNEQLSYKIWNIEALWIQVCQLVGRYRCYWYMLHCIPCSQERIEEEEMLQLFHSTGVISCATMCKIQFGLVLRLMLTIAMDKEIN